MELILVALLIAIACTALAAIREHRSDIPTDTAPEVHDPFEDHPMHCKCYNHS